MPQFGAFLSLTLEDLNLMNLINVHGVDSKNFTISLLNYDLVYSSIFYILAASQSYWHTDQNLK